MSQNNISFEGSMTGASMLDERLTPLLNNIYSSNSGSTRPSYLQAGGTWFDSPNGKLMLFNGISEIPLSTLMTATETEAVTGSDDTKAMTPSGTNKVVGIGKYYVTRTYAKDDVILNVDEGEIKLYQSLIDNNIGNDLTDETKWKIVRLGGGGGEIGDIGFAPLGIDESLNLRRYLNGQVISQSQFASFTNKVKAAVVLYPSLATTETNWQSEKSLSKLGQCGKFVIDDTAGTIRLPCVVNAQGLTDLQYLGTIKNESLPNINISSCGIGESNSMFHRTAGYPTSYVARGDGQSGLITEPFASLTSSTYQNGAPVQQEAVQYPYYIQVATGIEETLPAIREYKTNVPYVLGDSKYFEANPYNASWLESNGQYNSSTVYPDLWSQLQVELNSSLNVGDTIEISGKTYVKRGLPVVLSTDTITDYDFVVNQNDQTFRLPLKNGQTVPSGWNLYYYVGDTVQDASLINAGAVLGQLSNKADIDASNFNADGKSLLSGLGMPSGRYIDLTVGASDSTYTAPANGWFFARHTTTSETGQTYIYNNSNGEETGSISMDTTWVDNPVPPIAAKKGDVITLRYIRSTVTLFRFIYAEGDKNV